MKIIFFGTSEFAVPALKALFANGYELMAIITMPDAPAGREHILTPPPVKQMADSLGLTVLQPATLKSDEFFEEFKSLNPDLCVVAAYGNIIPQRYLDVLKHGFINIHPSLLPKYRGPTPIQSAILNGETETGVMIMQVDAEMDHGAILTRTKYQITNTKGYKEIHDELAEIGANLLIETIPKYVSGEIKPVEQDHAHATFCKMLNREDGRIDWSRSPEHIYNQIQALNPEPGTWTIWQDKILNIKHAEFVDNKLSFVTIQLEGKKETTFKDFLTGHLDFDISQCK